MKGAHDADGSCSSSSVGNDAHGDRSRQWARYSAQRCINKLKDENAVLRSLLAGSGGLLQSIVAGGIAARDHIVGTYPITGKAKFSLGTALRANVVRTHLGSTDQDLLTELDYLADVESAIGHLSQACVAGIVSISGMSYTMARRFLSLMATTGGAS